MISTRLQQEEEDEPTPRSVDGTAPPTRFEAVNRVLRRIQIITCRTIDDWMDALWNENGLITQALTRPKQSLRIIIVDSIADLFRHDDNITSHPANSYAPPTTATKSQSFFVQRSTQLFLMTQRLHQLMQPFLSSQQPLSVLILNQVTMTTTTSHWPEQPALGLTWSNCVHSRFRVQKRHVAYEVEEDDDDHQPTATTIHTTNPPPTHLPPIVAAATATGVAPHKRILRAQRTLTVTHSTRYPMTSTNFIIAAGGCYPSPP